MAAVQNKSRRPVLPSYVAHAHAFAVVPTPGNPSSAKTGSSYFALPSPPAPLRAFTLPQAGESSRDIDERSTYPNSVASSERDENSIPSAEKRPRSATSPDRKVPWRSPEAPKSTKSHTHSSASISGATTLQFATAAPFGVNRAGSPHISSSSHSTRSALSIAEIDCFFVQGSQSSTYSARSPPRSRPTSECAGLSDYSADLALSSNDEASDMWTSDQAERERQRAERQASMRARKEAREEMRRQKRLARVGAVGELGAQTKSTWSEAIRSQGTLSSDGAPASRVRKRAATMDPKTLATALGRVVALAASADTPTPSGPGPPDHALSDSGSIDTLASDLTSSLSTLASEILENPQPKDATPQRAPGDPQATPALSRFDSGKTEMGTPPRLAET